MQIAEPAEAAFMSFWQGEPAARQEAVPCAAVLLRQHADVAGSSLPPPAAPTFAEAPHFSLHENIIYTLGLSLSDLGHKVAASCVSEVCMAVDEQWSDSDYADASELLRVGEFLS